MQMRLTSEPLRLPPHTCVVTGRIDGEMIDFNVTPACTQPPNIAILRPVIEEAATKYCEMVPAKQLVELQAQFDELDEELRKVKKAMELTGELEELLEPEGATNV